MAKRSYEETVRGAGHVPGVSANRYLVINARDKEIVCKKGEAEDLAKHLGRTEIYDRRDKKWFRFDPVTGKMTYEVVTKPSPALR